MKTPLSTLIIAAFLVNTFGPLPAQAQELYLPKPGVRVGLSPEFNPPVLKGIKVHPDNPFRFDFILDKGDGLSSPNASVGGPDKALKEESTKLIKYFLASLTVPEKDLWVNLSPYEKDRIVPQSFGLTEMGRDLLAQDYLLKQITASLIYPEDEFGKKFWKRVYEEAAKKFGTTNIPVNTFNKVWIVPEKAVVYENAKAGTAYVVESKLKVMLEQDYLALEKNIAGRHVEQAAATAIDPNVSPSKDVNALGSQIVREIVIPQLTREVNENKNFSQLRQVYNSLILATWYKKKIKDSILNQVYSDKNKVQGVNIDDPQEKQKIYQQYLVAFKKGVYNYIKEETDPITQQMIPRKYFSGGMAFNQAMSVKLQIVNDQSADAAMLSKVGSRFITKGLLIVLTSLALIQDGDRNIATYPDAENQQENVQQLEISQTQVEEVVKYAQNWRGTLHSTDNINAPLAADVIDAAFRGKVNILTQEEMDRITREHKDYKDVIKMYSATGINILLKIPPIRAEFVHRHSAKAILRMIALYDKLKMIDLSPILYEDIDTYVNLITPETLTQPEGGILIDALGHYKYGKPSEAPLVTSELTIDDTKNKELALKLSAQGKTGVLIQYLLSHNEGSIGALDFLFSMFYDLPGGEQTKIVDVAIHLIFQSKDANVRVGAERALFVAALLPQYSVYIKDHVLQQREIVNALPEKRFSKEVQLIVFDDFKEQEENGLIHGEMVLSRILTGLLGKEINLTQNGYKEQLGLADKDFSPVEAAAYILRGRNITLHALQANQPNAMASLTALLDQNKNNTTVVNISMGGYIQKIFGLELKKEDPKKVNGAFPMEVFAPSLGRDHVFFFSAGNGEEISFGGSIGKLPYGKPRLFSHKMVDQFVFVGAASENMATKEWERDFYSDYGQDVASYAPTGPWRGTSFSAPFETGVTLSELTSNPNMPVKTAKENLERINPQIHEKVKYDDGYPQNKDKAMINLKQDHTQESTKTIQGGIDLTSGNMDLQTQNDGIEIKFYLDPAMLRQLQNTSGLAPVIINIQPVSNIGDFLGFAQPQNTPV